MNGGFCVRDCKGLVPVFIGTEAKRSPEKPDLSRSFNGLEERHN